VSTHPYTATHPDPVVTHPFWYEPQPSFVVIDEGASVQILGAQGPGVSTWVPLHLPSEPMYPSQVVIVPKYPEQEPRVPMQPFPVVLQPN